MHGHDKDIPGCNSTEKIYIVGLCHITQAHGRPLYLDVVDFIFATVFRFVAQLQFVVMQNNIIFIKI